MDVAQSPRWTKSLTEDGVSIRKGRSVRKVLRAKSNTGLHPPPPTPHPPPKHLFRGPLGKKGGYFLIQHRQGSGVGQGLEGRGDEVRGALEEPQGRRHPNLITRIIHLLACNSSQAWMCWEREPACGGAAGGGCRSGASHWG